MGVEDGSKTTMLMAVAAALESFTDWCENADHEADAAYAANLAFRVRELARVID